MFMWRYPDPALHSGMTNIRTDLEVASGHWPPDLGDYTDSDKRMRFHLFK